MCMIKGEFLSWWTEGKQIIYNGIEIAKDDINAEYVHILCKAYGVHPKGTDLPEYEGKKYMLDIYCFNEECFFGIVEVRMNYYLLYTFDENDMKKIKVFMKRKRKN